MSDIDTTIQLLRRAEAAEARVAELEAQNARLREALTDSSATLWNVLHNGMLVPAARRSQLEQIETTIKAALADGKAAP